MVIENQRLIPTLTLAVVLSTSACGGRPDDDDGPVADSCETVVHGLSDVDVRIHGALDESHLGAAVSFAGDVDGDGFDDILAMESGVQDDESRMDTILVLLGPVTGGLTTADADIRLLGEEGESLYPTPAAAGDVNGDGLDDVLVGMPLDSTYGEHQGAAYLFHGPLPDGARITAGEASFHGEAAEDHAGEAVSAAGDVDGDGFGDLLIGARYCDAAGSWAGAAYVVLGPVEGEVELAQADIRLLGEAAGDGAGWHVAPAGDVNADGMDDVLISAHPPPDDGHGEEARESLPATMATGNPDGAVYLLRGPIEGTDGLAEAGTKIVGGEPDAHVGAVMAGVGDLDGDGLGDIAVGGPTEWEDISAVYLFRGPVRVGTLALSDADMRVDGLPARGSLTCVAAAGDLDGDGLGEILVGSSGDSVDTYQAGTAWLFASPLEEMQTLCAASHELRGDRESDFAGAHVAGAGDLDGDGLDDLLVGASGFDAEGDTGSNHGAIYVVPGTSVPVD